MCTRECCRVSEASIPAQMHDPFFHVDEVSRDGEGPCANPLVGRADSNLHIAAHEQGVWRVLEEVNRDLKAYQKKMDREGQDESMNIWRERERAERREQKGESRKEFSEGCKRTGEGG